MRNEVLPCVQLCVVVFSPVLLLGILIGKKRYHCSKFFNVLLIVAGVALFMYTEVRGQEREGRGGEGRGEERRGEKGCSVLCGALCHRHRVVHNMT